MGSAVTVGSGVPLNTLYNVTKEAGKYYVGGNTASVVAAGGYVQGGGHSIFSPIFGLAADNALGSLLSSCELLSCILTKVQSSLW